MTPLPFLKLSGKSLFAISTIVLASVLSGGGHLFDSAMASDKKETRAEKKARKKRIKQGRTLYKMNGCNDCHRVKGKGCKRGIPLDGIGRKRSRKFIEGHLVDPEEHVKKNSVAYANAPNMMPDMNLGKDEINAIAEYLFSLPERKYRQPEEDKDMD